MHVKFIEIPPYCSGNLQTSFSSLRLGKSTLSEILTLLSEILTLLSERSRGERITPRLRSGCMWHTRDTSHSQSAYIRNDALNRYHIFVFINYTNPNPIDLLLEQLRMVLEYQDLVFAIPRRVASFLKHYTLHRLLQRKHHCCRSPNLP